MWQLMAEKGASIRQNLKKGWTAALEYAIVKTTKKLIEARCGRVSGGGDTLGTRRKAKSPKRIAGCGSSVGHGEKIPMTPAL